MFWWIFAAVFAVTFFIFLIIFGYFCFLTANVRHKSYPADRRAHGGGSPAPEHGERIFAEALAWFDAQKYEPLYLRSSDGLRLFGRLIQAKGTARGIVIGFHGYHSSARRDLVVQTRALHEAGYHVLLISQRAHGKSEGKYICFGVKEREDAVAWCHLAHERFPTLPIALLGLSMGASTVLFASALKLPDSVRAIIADCGFTSPFAIIRRTLHRKHKIVPYPIIFFMNAWSRLLAGFNYRDASTEQALRESRLPTLLIHGSEDRYVPAAMSERIASLVPEHAELFVVEGARHAQAVLYEPEEYIKRMLAFLDKNGV